MLKFVKLNEETSCDLCSCYKKSPFLISDYSIGIKTMWSSVLNPSYAIASGCIIVKTERDGGVFFDFPMPFAEEFSITDAINEISLYSRENFIPLVFENVPREYLGYITSVFRSYDVSYKRGLSDYLYYASKLADMSGRSYSAQRNHIKKFKTKYPNAVFKTFAQEDIPAIRAFLSRFSSTFSDKSDGAAKELLLAKRMISRIGSSCFRCGGYVLDKEIISICFSEKCGEMLIDHIEKALTEFEGIYPATVQSFLQCFGHDVKYFNREDDASDIGLRMSKLQYHPIRIVNKYTVHVKNELSSFEDDISFSSERLSFSPITEEDIESYNKLCMDDERNKYWGYDYKNDCSDPDEYYFYNDQKRDMDNKMSLTLAIRYDGQIIGEVILHNFDCKGQAEIGIRVLPEYSGRGYGREALRSVLRFAIYTIGLDTVVAKCYKENIPSMNMLSSVMRKDREDNEFMYFASSF